MTFSKHLNRATFALPLVVVAMLAALLPPPKPREMVETIVVASLGCDATGPAVGPMGLVRVPGDLGLLTRRLNCNT